MSQKASFTLVELLIVIGILAILTASIVLIINPAQRLKEARDSTRIQELSALEHTISILLTQQDRLFIGTSTYVYISIPDSSSTCGNLGLPALPAGFTYQCAGTSTLRHTDGTGWIPIDFTNSSITQLPTLPLDPTNTTSSGLYYTYMMGGSFELTALMEATKDNASARDDGGSLPGVYETGTHIGLTPATRDKGLVGYWTFDEGSGTSAYDSSGNSNTGTLTNGPTWQTASSCKVGGCLSFDGSNDYVNVGNRNSLNLISVGSVSGWIKVHQFNVYPSVIGKGASAGWDTDGYGIELFESNYIKGFITNRSNTPIKDTVVFGTSSVDVWNYYVMKWDGNFFYAYYNGSEVSKVSQTLSVPITNYDFLIGKLQAYFNGTLDDVRIYNRALSAAEIQAIYNATK